MIGDGDDAGIVAHAGPAAARSHFSLRWIVLADAGGQVPGLCDFAHVAQALRDALMSRWGGPVPELISGHAGDGKPSRTPHLAIVPLADVGLPDSDGRLLGVGLVLPQAADNSEIAWKLRAMLLGDAAVTAAPELRLVFGANGVWRLQADPTPRRAMLRAERYLTPSTRWSSVTPVIYDRFPERTRGDEAEEIVANSCVNAGLPRPAQLELMAQSAIEGATPTLDDGMSFGAKPWSFPARRDGSAHPLNARLKMNVRLTFSEPVAGPVLIGAGRFSGLGLCLPEC